MEETQPEQEQPIKIPNIDSIAIAVLFVIVVINIIYLLILEHRYNDVVIKLNDCRQAATDSIINWTDMGNKLWR